MAKPGYETVAIGTWLYDGKIPKQIALTRRPAMRACCRWVETDAGDFVLDETKPIPSTSDGMVYYVGITSGGEFLSAEAALAWASTQPWGPINWKFIS